jgi:hypothetical protein
MKKIILLGGLLGAGGSAWIFVGVWQDRDWLWLVAIAICFLAVLVSVRGMWLGKRWSLWLSFLPALASLGLGLYIMYFRWTFWLWKEPTLTDRLLSITVENLGGLLFILFPLFWLVYFIRPSIRNQFH